MYNFYIQTFSEYFLMKLLLEKFWTKLLGVIYSIAFQNNFSVITFDLKFHIRTMAEPCKAIHTGELYSFLQ